MLSTKFKESLGPFFPIANKIKLFLLKIKLKGNAVFCPCCKKSFKIFATFGNERRKNSRCPTCESLERHRLLWMYLENKTNLYKDNLRVLHVAPETVFFHLFKKQKNIDYYPCDIYNNLYPKGTIYFDLLNHNLPDNSFDTIICNHVFQYIDDDKKAMQNIYKLMKPGGWAILQVPINTKSKLTYENNLITDPLEREKEFGLKEHVRYYSFDYADKLRDIGFNVNVDDYSAEFSTEENYRYGFWQGDSIYYCTK